MSTKYYGYRLQNTNLENVFKILQQNLSVFQEKFSLTIKRKFVKYIYDSIDMAIVYPEKCQQCEIKQLADKFDKQLFCGGYNVEYKVQICLFPYKNDVLIMNYSNYIYQDIIDGFKWEDYSYWNSTDKLDSVTDQEWNERLKTWQSICPDKPINNSLMFTPVFYEWTDLASFWNYKDLQFFLKIKHKLNRLQKYQKNNFSVWGKFVEDQLVDITSDNFNDKFLMVIPQKIWW